MNSFSVPAFLLPQKPGIQRRAFLRVAGASAATVTLVLAGCGDPEPEPIAPNTNQLNLSPDANGLLNYVYLLKQLSTAFYKKVVDAPPTDLRTGEKAFFDDLHDHELVHRETLRFLLATAAYDAQLATPLAFDFTSFTLTSRAGVLAAARQLEDLLVAAFAGVLRLVRTPASVLFLAKMASVNARHAAFVRDLLLPGSFADDSVVVSANGLRAVSPAKTPAQVMTETKAFFAPIVVNTALLPTA